MNKRFFSASRLMGAMLCLMLAITAFTSCREDDDKDAFRFTSGVISMSPATDITHNSAVIVLNIASGEVLNMYEKYNVRVWTVDEETKEETEVYNETFTSPKELVQKIELADLLPLTTYNYQATAYTTIGTQTGEYRTAIATFTTPSLEAEEEEGISEGEFIDLGTGVEWASCNLGATSPEQNPNFYACNDDAVKAELGTTLRLPTEAEVLALVDKCKWTWYEHNGVWGYRVASTITGKSIFLPAAGMYAAGAVNGLGAQGCYWVDNANLDENATTASAFNFTQGWNDVFNSYPLYSGLSVRPVKK
ncbi:MAG: hypothetical protein ACI3X6_01415 [Alloprevotella sp.]